MSEQKAEHNTHTCAEVYILKIGGLFSFQLHTDLITREPLMCDWQIKQEAAKNDGIMGLKADTPALNSSAEVNLDLKSDPDSLWLSPGLVCCSTALVFVWETEKTNFLAVICLSDCFLMYLI